MIEGLVLFVIIGGGLVAYAAWEWHRSQPKARPTVVVRLTADHGNFSRSLMSALEAATEFDRSMRRLAEVANTSGQQIEKLGEALSELIEGPSRRDGFAEQV